MNEEDHDISEYEQTLERICRECGQPYKIADFIDSWSHYFKRPYNYRERCETYCLACWLGVGPNDFPEAHLGEPARAANTPPETIVTPEDTVRRTNLRDEWPFGRFSEVARVPDVLAVFEWFLDRGAHLALMPIARVYLDRSVAFPDAKIFYPSGAIDLDRLNLVPNRLNTDSLAERCSAASGITYEILDKHPLIVFPYFFDWQRFRTSSHASHMEFVRDLSTEVDHFCLNFARYRLCRLGVMDDLPARAGQINSNHMMAGAMLYNSELRESRIIGGAPFTHYLTRGLGLPLTQIEWHDFPRNGEVGQIVNHALSLYSAILESSDLTARFMQSLSLLEFLAFPDEYRKFEEVKKVIARYVARSTTEYQRLLDRFFELTGKKDADTGKIIGYRTKVVHMGERIEALVPNPHERAALFSELDGYIRPVIDHMIEHSKKSFEPEYLNVRDRLRPFET